MTNAMKARRLRSIAWRMSLWQKSYLYCCTTEWDLYALTPYRTPSEGWEMMDQPFDLQILFVLFVAEAIEQGDME